MENKKTESVICKTCGEKIEVFINKLPINCIAFSTNNNSKIVFKNKETVLSGNLRFVENSPFPENLVLFSEVTDMLKSETLNNPFEKFIQNALNVDSNSPLQSTGIYLTCFNNHENKYYIYL